MAVAAVWGWTFVLVKDAISQYPTAPFLAIRFAIAAVLLGMLLRRPPGRRVLRFGVPIGLVLAAGYALQTYGLQFTTPGEAGLLTGLFIVFTPLVERVTGRPVPPRTWAAVVVALGGTVLLTGAGSTNAFGDLLEIGCAVAFAVHIVLLSRWSPSAPPLSLATVQMATAALMFAVPSVPLLRPPSAPVMMALLVTGVVASAVGFLVQTWAQSHLTASRAALAIAAEPAWALLFGVLLAGQRFAPLQAAGAALLLTAVVGHEVVGQRLARVGQAASNIH